jgi:large subunit ribosomal protein L33
VASEFLQKVHCIFFLNNSFAGKKQTRLTGFSDAASISSLMREQVILECTEAKAAGVPASRYTSTRNKKKMTEKVEKKKYNPFLKRHTVHREIK